MKKELEPVKAFEPAEISHKEGYLQENSLFIIMTINENKMFPVLDFGAPNLVDDKFPVKEFNSHKEAGVFATIKKLKSL